MTRPFSPGKSGKGCAPHRPVRQGLRSAPPGPVSYTEFRREQGCTGKKAYFSQTLAENYLTLLTWAGLADETWNAYACEFCSDYHLGHQAKHYLTPTR